MTFVSLTIDTEEEWNWSSGFSQAPGGVANICEGLIPFHELCKSYGLKPTYFTNFSVLNDSKASPIIRKIAADPSSEIGLHIHPWNTPPFDNQQTSYPRHSFLHNLSRELAIAKIQSVFNAFYKEGIVPTSFRGGRYSTSPHIQQFLAENSIIADASVMPFTSWVDDGAPNFENRNLIPVRRQFAGDSRFIWELPLTLAFTRGPEQFWRHVFRRLSCKPFSRFRMIGVIERFFCKRIWLNLENPLTDRIPLLLSKLKTRKLPHINITLHSSSLIVGQSPYTKNQHHLNLLKLRLKQCVESLSEWDHFTPATVSEIATKLEKQYHACARHKSS
jgi:hypothetical protein